MRLIRSLQTLALALIATSGLTSPAAAQLLNQVPGANGLQQRMGGSVQTTCGGLIALGVNPAGTGATSDLLTQCTAMVLTATPVNAQPSVAAGPLGLTANGLNQALLQVSNDEGGAIGVNQNQVAFVQVANLQQRFVALRDGATGISIAGLKLRHDGETFSGDEPFLRKDSASGDVGSLPAGLGMFVTGSGDWGDFDGSGEQLGFGFDSWGVTGGVDYRFTDEIVAGLAFGYVGSRAGFDGGNGHLDTDAYIPSVYASYNQGGLYADAIFSYTYDAFDLTRRINYSTIHRAAEGSTHGNEYSFSIGGGYEFDLKQVAEGLTLGPRVRFDYANEDVGSFTETGANGLNLRYRDYQIESAVSVVGGEASYAISTPFGVVTPQLRADWNHEFAADPARVRASFAADPNQVQFYVRPARLNRDFMRLGVGIVGTFTYGISAFVDWETILALHNVQNNTLHVGARYEF